MGNAWLAAIESYEGPDVAALSLLNSNKLLRFYDPYGGTTAEGKWRFNALGYALECINRERGSNAAVYLPCVFVLIKRFQDLGALNSTCARRMKKGKVQSEYTPLAFAHVNNLYDEMVVLLMSGAFAGSVNNCVTERWMMCSQWNMDIMAVHMHKLGATDFMKLELNWQALLRIPYSEWTSRTRQPGVVLERFVEWMSCKKERGAQWKAQQTALVTDYDRKHPYDGLNAPRHLQYEDEQQQEERRNGRDVGSPIMEERIQVSELQMRVSSDLSRAIPDPPPYPPAAFTAGSLSSSE